MRHVRNESECVVVIARAQQVPCSLRLASDRSKTNQVSDKTSAEDSSQSSQPDQSRLRSAVDDEDEVVVVVSEVALSARSQLVVFVMRQ